MPTISDLPVELLIDVLLPILPNSDLVALAATNKWFQNVCNDDMFWKRKCDKEFNFNGAGTARRTGWKFIYRGLTKPKAYVWGSASNGRLGLTRPPRTSGPGVPYPVPLQLPSKTIVNLAAGGWSFHALDSEGQLFVCGQLDGERFARLDGFSESGACTETPLHVRMPAPIRSVSCGRKHTMALDANGQVWTFGSWGRPFRLDTPLLATSEESTVVQVESGWMYCSVLTHSGDVYVWWPFEDPMHSEYTTRMRQMDAEGDKFAEATKDKVIPSVTWDFSYNPPKLPELPDLPELKHVKPDYGATKPVLKLAKIAAMDNVLIGLTNKGHVLKFGGLSNESNMRTGHWEYLPYFSELDRVQSNSGFNQAEQAPGEEPKLSPPTDLQITHISAHFEHFVAYSTGTESIVLIGTNDIAHDEPADILPELQYKSIISVVLGDYHFAALTADGKLYTWGRFSSGALGLGDPAQLAPGTPGGYKTQDQLDRALRSYRHVEVPEVEVPSQVRFDHGEKTKKDKFCFAVTAAGWHTGALVLEPDQEEEEKDSTILEEEEEEHTNPTATMPGHFDPNPSTDQTAPPMHPGHIPILWQARGHAPFRIGFAGRGRFNVPGGLRGRGIGQPPGDGQ